MGEIEFQTWKTAAVILAFTVSITLQWYSPLQDKPRDIVKNWRLNLPLALLNAIILGAICTGCACTVSIYEQKHGLGLFNVLGIDSLSGAAVGLFVLDFTAYSWHVANHRVAFLWRFHSVHHSDEIFDASTAVRFHIGELLVSLVVRLAIVAFFGLPVLGILAFEIVYAFFNFFEHGNIRLPEGFSRKFAGVFVTPDLHRFHHSADKRHLNTNFGTIFSVWDRVFQTLEKEVRRGSYRVGVPEPAPWASNFIGTLTYPFLKRRPG